MSRKKMNGRNVVSGLLRMGQLKKKRERRGCENENKGVSAKLTNNIDSNDSLKEMMNLVSDYTDVEVSHIEKIKIGKS